MKKLFCFVGILVSCFLVSNSYALVKVSVFNETLTRGEGAPVTDSFTFPGVTGPAVIRLTNGSAEDSDVERVSSSVISVNGTTVFSASNFNQNTSTMDAEIILSEGENTIDVLLKSKPGGQIIVPVT